MKNKLILLLGLLMLLCGCSADSSQSFTFQDRLVEYNSATDKTADYTIRKFTELDEQFGDQWGIILMLDNSNMLIRTGQEGMYTYQKYNIETQELTEVFTSDKLLYEINEYYIQDNRNFAFRNHSGDLAVVKDDLAHWYDFFMKRPQPDIENIVPHFQTEQVLYSNSEGDLFLSDYNFSTVEKLPITDIRRIFWIDSENVVLLQAVERAAKEYDRFLIRYNLTSNEYIKTKLDDDFVVYNTYFINSPGYLGFKYNPDYGCDDSLAILDYSTNTVTKYKFSNTFFQPRLNNNKIIYCSSREVIKDSQDEYSVSINLYDVRDNINIKVADIDKAKAISFYASPDAKTFFISYKRNEIRQCYLYTQKS